MGDIHDNPNSVRQGGDPHIRFFLRGEPAPPRYLNADPAFFFITTAGYNAGPRRPVQWRSKLAGPVEGAIFAETIPFTETRLYVKNVMSNAIYYATLFTGEPQLLKERLGTVAPAANRKVALP